MEKAKTAKNAAFLFLTLNMKDVAAVGNAVAWGGLLSLVYALTVGIN